MLFFSIFKIITKIFKISSGNKKLTELLFENLQRKKIIRFDELKFLKLNQINSENNNILKSLVNNLNKTTNKSSNDLSTAQLNCNDSIRNVAFQSVRRSNPNNKLRLFHNSNKQVSDYNNRRANRFLNTLIASPVNNENKKYHTKNYRNSPQIQINKISSKKIDNNNNNK